jgi:hypothetical protein
MAVRAATDLARIAGVALGRDTSERLLPGDLPRLCAALESSGLILSVGTDLEARLKKLCGLYESAVLALATWLLVPLPAWIPTVVEENEDEPDLLTFADFGGSEVETASQLHGRSTQASAAQPDRLFFAGRSVRTVPVPTPLTCPVKR